MSEINHSQSTPPFLTVLVLLLVAAVGIQTWYMLEMKQKLDTIQSDPSSSQSENLDIAEASSKPGTENTVDYSENGAALKQSKQATQKTRTDKTNLTTDNLASPVPPSSDPPDLADENFFNTHLMHRHGARTRKYNICSNIWREASTTGITTLTITDRIFAIVSGRTYQHRKWICGRIRINTSF